jgi:hypothetical protein
MKKEQVGTLLALFSASVLVISFIGCGSKKSLEAGSTWEISETTKLSGLTIGEGAGIKAPESKAVTMTIDGIESEIEPGDYKGDIVLTVTDEIKMSGFFGDAGGAPGGAGGGGGETASGSEVGGIAGGERGGAPGGERGGAPGGAGNSDLSILRTAIYVDGNAYVPEKSVSAAVKEGKVTNNSATDVSIKSIGKDFNGIIVSGDSTYTINNLKIDFNGGDQGNNGAAVTSQGNSEVTINNASIFSKGVQRAAIVVAGSSIMHVNDSNIETQDGTLAEQYAKMEDANSMEVPWVLGFIGNNRATNVIQNGTVYYTNTHVKTQRWGCLSTDAAQAVKLYATKCHLEAVESGYGAYSIGDTITAFDECLFDVHDYGLIMTGQGSATFTNKTLVNSGRIGVLSHGGNVGKLDINKGTVFNTEKTAIQLKSSYTAITVDSAELNSKNGVILEAIVNDDPWMKSSGNKMSEGSNNAARPINATFKNMKLKGDIINAMTAMADMNISLENTTMTGAVTTATSMAQADIDGVKISKKTYYYIGAVKNTYCATNDKYGLNLNLGMGSNWIIDKTSYLTGITIAEGCSITAPQGYSVSLTVNGSAKPIKAGSYTGKIVLAVEKKS